MTFAVNIAQGGSNNTTFRNRIINGAMVIDQRNAGASLTSPSSSFYALDRWNLFASQASKFTVQQNAGSVTPPAGFKNYLGITSSSAYTVGASELFIVGQAIEGFNTADLGFGASGASTITLSFWVRSSLTGTFGGSLLNSAQNRSYPFSYTISSANTWTQISVTIAGDTTGTWVGATNGVGLFVYLSIGVGSSLSGTAGAWAGSNYFSSTGATSVVGTNGATFYITGVQLEKGTAASPFEVRLYGTELALCQRYYQSYTIPMLRGVFSAAGSVNRVGMTIPTMRANPTLNSSGTFDIYDGGTTGTVTSFTAVYTRQNSVELDATVATGTFTTGRPCVFFVGANTGILTASAEL